MIKELIKLANHLDDKGLTKEADIVDNIIKSAGEFEDGLAEDIKSIMYGKPTWEPDAPKPTLAPIEEPDMDHPVFNSGETKDGGECGEITDALLALLGTENDMDKFYKAAVDLINTIKKLYNHPELDYIYYAPKVKVKSVHSLFSPALINKYDDDGNPLSPGERKALPEYEGDTELVYRLHHLITYVAQKAIHNFDTHIEKLFLKELGVNPECVKSMYASLVNSCQEREDKEREHAIKYFNMGIDKD